MCEVLFASGTKNHHFYCLILVCDKTLPLLQFCSQYSWPYVIQPKIIYFDARCQKFIVPASFIPQRAAAVFCPT